MSLKPPPSFEGYGATLPPHWTCPNCSATKDQFLVLTDD
jgi:rubredoxin